MKGDAVIFKFPLVVFLYVARTILSACRPLADRMIKPGALPRDSGKIARATSALPKSGGFMDEYEYDYDYEYDDVLA